MILCDYRFLVFLKSKPCLTYSLIYLGDKVWLKGRMQDCPGQGWETGLQRGLQQGPKEGVQAGI